MSRTLRRALVALGTLAGLLLGLRKLLAPGVFLVRRDVFRLYLPLEEFIARELGAGRIPTWLPLDGLGVSLWGASVPGLLHPRHLLLALLSPAQALKWTVVLALCAAAVGSWLLVRELGAAPAARALAAAGYGLSGYLLSMSDNTPYLLSAATLPWVAWGAERLGRRPTVRAALTLGLALALAAWSGDLQAALGQALLATVLVLARGVRRDRVVGLLTALVLAALWQGPAVAAVLDLARGSGRLGGLARAVALKWSMAPVRLFELAFGAPYPQALVDDPRSSLAARYLGGADGSLWAASVEVGAVMVVLALAGLRSGGGRSRWRYGAVAAVGLWLALGASGGLYPVLLRLPVFNAFRYPEKLLPFFLLGLAVLAARGLAVLAGRGWARALGACALVLVAVALGVTPGLVQRILTGLDAGAVPAEPEVVAAVTAGLKGQLLWGALCAGLLAMIALRRKLVWAAPLCQLVVGVWRAGPLLVTAPVELLARRPPLLDPAVGLAQRSPRLCQSVAAYHFDAPPTGEGEELSARANIDALAPALPMRAGLAITRAYLPGFPQAFAALCDGRACGTACSRRLGAGGGVVSEELFEALQRDGAGLTPIARARNPAVVLFADPFARPFAEPVAAHVVRTPEEAAQAIAATPAHPGAEVVLVGTGEDERAPPGAVALSRPRPDRIEGQAALDAPGWVVIREACARGWQARIDGQAAPLESADLALCAVRLPAGTHQVALQYVPPGWRLGWAAYGLGWALCAALGFASRRANGFTRGA